MYPTAYHTTDLVNLRFLITGGAGFIGSHLAEYLLQFGAGKVRVLDNLSTGKSENIFLFRDHPRYEFVEGDIRDAAVCKEAVKDIDYVLHQAALGSVPRSIIDPATTNAVNITGFLNMLIASKEGGIKRMVYAASSSTYGDSRELPKTEEKIGRPLSPYAVTKYVNELYADTFSRTYHMEQIGLRYFNVFGPRQDPDGAYAAVIPRFIRLLIDHQPPVINGDGNHSRDFTYVDNVVQANLLALFTQEPLAVNTVFNVAFGEQTTLNQLVVILKRYLSPGDEFIAGLKEIHGPAREGDIPHSLASIEKAVRLLGYVPRYSFSEGLKETVSWYLENYPAKKGL